MQKWEYQIIEIVRGKAIQVNGELFYKVPPKGLSFGETYTLGEYLSKIGQDGWEVAGVGTRALLFSPEPGIDYSETASIVAKRLML